MKKSISRILSLALFLIGVLLVIDSQANITGAVIGASKTTSFLKTLIGFSLILAAAIVLTVGGLEYRIKRPIEKIEQTYKKLERRKKEFENSHEEFEKWYTQFSKEKSELKTQDSKKILKDIIEEYDKEKYPEGVNLLEFAKNHVKELYGKILNEKREAEKLVYVRMNPAEKVLHDRQVNQYTSMNNLIRLAKKCGYEVGEEGRTEGRSVYRKLEDGKKVFLTVIPRNRNINHNTARGIIEVYAIGEPSFRRS